MAGGSAAGRLSATVFADLPSSVYEPREPALVTRGAVRSYLCRAMHPAIGIATVIPFRFSFRRRLVAIQVVLTREVTYGRPAEKKNGRLSSAMPIAGAWPA